MLNGHFVIDAVTHAFNMDDSNFAHQAHARAISDVIYAVNNKSVPDGYGLPESAVFRDWTMEDTVGMLFHESDTDVGIYHSTPIMAYKDGLSSVEKGIEAIERWPQRIVGAYAALDPLVGNAKAIESLDRQLERYTPMGIKLYPSTWQGDTTAGWRMDDPKIAYPIYEAAMERGIRHVAVHKSLPMGPAPTGQFFHPGDLELAASDFPDITFEIVHGGAAFTEETAWLIGRFENIYVNLETLPVFLITRPEVFAKLILGMMHVGGEAMLDKMYWATGAMQCHPRLQLEAFAGFSFPEELLDQYGLFGPLPQLSEEHRAKILAGNYARAHGLDVDALARGIAGDEFDRKGGPPAAPYSTTAVAGDVLSAA